MGPSCSQLTKLPPKETRGKTAAQFCMKASFYSWHAPAAGGLACHWLCFALAFAAAGALCAAWWLFASNPCGHIFRLSRMTCSVLPNHNTWLLGVWRADRYAHP